VHEKHLDQEIPSSFSPISRKRNRLVYQPFSRLFSADARLVAMGAFGRPFVAASKPDKERRKKLLGSD